MRNVLRQRWNFGINTILVLLLFLENVIVGGEETYNGGKLMLK